MLKAQLLSKAQFAKSERLWKEWGWRTCRIWQMERRTVQIFRKQTRRILQLGSPAPKLCSLKRRKMTVDVPFKYYCATPLRQWFQGETTWMVEMRRHFCYCWPKKKSPSLTLHYSNNSWFYSGGFWITWSDDTLQFWCLWLSSCILFLSQFGWKAWVHVCVFMHTHRLLRVHICVHIHLCVWAHMHVHACALHLLRRFRLAGFLVDDQPLWKKSTPTNITWN